MHQLQKTESLSTQWKDGEKQSTISEQLLEIIPQEEWLTPEEIYSKYSYRDKDAVTYNTVSNYLSELQRQGKLEAKGRTQDRKYRKADRPIQETREDYSSPLSEGLPGFMEKRIEREVQRRVSKQIQRMEKDLEDLIEQRLNQLENKSFNRMKAEIDRIERRINQETEKTPDQEETVEVEPSLKDDKYDVLRKSLSGQWQSISQVMESYRSQVKDPKTRRTVLRRLNKLVDKGEVEIKGKTTGREYRLKK